MYTTCKKEKIIIILQSIPSHPSKFDKLDMPLPQSLNFCTVFPNSLNIATIRTSIVVFRYCHYFVQGKYSSEIEKVI